MDIKQFNFTPEFIFELVMRRRWLILIPLCITLMIGIYLAFTLPRVYEARTLILIEPQRVPQSYVRSIVNVDARDRINTLSQQIMSRTNLEEIIADFNLYAGAKYDAMYDEDKIKDLSKRIKVLVTRSRGTDAFSISFKGKDPRTVMQITNALANSFIDANLVVREAQALGTSNFLDSELESSRKRLEQVEEIIKEYRKQYMGELPEQLSTNLRILDRLQLDLSDRQKIIREARVRLADLKSNTGQPSQQVLVISGSEKPSADGGASLEELQAKLESLSARYTQKHPDVVRLKKLIAELQSNYDKNSAENSNSATADTPQVRMSPLTRTQIFEVKRQIKLVEAEIRTISDQIKLYQERVENTPKREQELLGLRRDYNNIHSSYDSLLTRKLEADIAVNMERKQKGEQFRIIDPAKMPQKPVSPKTKKIFVVAVMAGLCLGGGVSVFLEYMDSSFKKPDELESSFELPVLTAIPQLLTERQVVFGRLNNIGSIFCAAYILCLVGIFGLISLKGIDPILSLFK